MKTFEEFIRNFGFTEYPFSTYTTENEKGRESELFVPPSDYSPIIQGFHQNQSMILIGNRGTGKTAILLDFDREIDKQKTIFCSIDDFSSLKLDFNLGDFYKFLIMNISIVLFEELALETKRLKRLDQEDKVLLSYLLSNFVPIVSKRIIKEKIERLQVSNLKRVGRNVYNFLRGIFNWGATVGVTLIDQYIAKHFKGLPDLNSEVNIKSFFPELPLTVDDSFNDMYINFQLLNDVLKVISKLGYEKTVLLLDKLDEDGRLDNNSEKIADFVKPILTDNKLLLNPSIQIVVSMWSTPFNYLVEHVRTQKHNCPTLNWYKADLVAVLNKRLEIFTNGKIKDFRELFSEQLTLELEDKIFQLANNNPRDLWHLFNKLMRSQYKLNPNSNRIVLTSIEPAFVDFVTTFNYFEYYPRKQNARANSMDFYSYTAHLLKLDSPVFTRNQLNEKAKTGGSTQNYVIGMERIGLIEKTTQNGGVIYYRVKDPKVVYAQQH
ncbi:P-loop ATPase, Sll1717 family [Brevibacillus sp. B_LB10_24]|uniref:P-loop ATPase, Sll1717 family n=1 Tax=Brevibacillus sp. B_LB10_24 TaxID=3380645 RepID=UPI0038B9E2F4